MLVTKQPVLHKFWHAVIPLAALSDGPQPFTWLDSDRLGILIRKKNLMDLLVRHSEAQVHG